MNFRQNFSFLKTKPTLKNKSYRGFYCSNNLFSLYVKDAVKLPDGSIIIAMTFASEMGFIDSNGYNYPGTIFKFSSEGVFDIAFYNNLSTKTITSINCIKTDGTDLYIGGASGSTGRLIKLSSLGVFDATFNSAVSGKFNGAINSIAISGSDLYIGGDFSSFNSTPNNANRIAKLNTSGVLNTTFSNNLDIVSGTKATSSGFNNSVNCVVVDGTDLYIGGAFQSFKSTTIGNANRIAKLSTSGVFNTTFSDNLDVVPGTKDSGTSGFDYNVQKIATDGSNLYVVGGFSHFKNVTYNAKRIAKLSMSGVFDTVFSDNLDIIPGTKSINSGFNNATITFGATAITIDGSDLYIGGDFSSFKIPSNNARKIAKLSTSGVFDTTFSNNLDVVSGTKAATSGFNDYDQNYITSIIVDGTNLIVTGGITSFKNTAAIGVKKISKLGTSENFIEAAYTFSRYPKSMVIDSEGNSYVGTVSGSLFNGKYTGGVVKILPNGELDDNFSNNIGSGFSGFGASINNMILLDNNLYIVGDFSSFNGTQNNARYIAKLSTSGVFDTAFSNNLDVVSGTNTTTSGFNTTTLSIETDGTSLYVGGMFTSFKGTANNARYIAKLSTSGVFDTAFSNNLDVVSGTKASTSGFNTWVRSIATDGTNLYIGGDFSSFKGVSNNARKIAKLSTSGVFDTAFSNNLDVVSGTKALTSGFSDSVYTLKYHNNNLYLGGPFVSFKNIDNNANRIAKLSTSGVFDTAFSNNLDVVSGVKTLTSGFDSGAISQLEIVNDSLFVAGGGLFKGTIIADIGKLSITGIYDSEFSNYQTSSGFDRFLTGMKYYTKYNCLVIIGDFSNFKGERLSGIYTISINT